MDLPTIGFRMAKHLRVPAVQAAGLHQVYYPAPSSIVTLAGLIFAGPFTLMHGGELIWEGTMRLQLMTPAEGRLAAEINAIEPLIAPIVQTFAPGTDAFHLRVPGQPGMVHQCRPAGIEPSQAIEYAGHHFTATTITFATKFITDHS